MATLLIDPLVRERWLRSLPPYETLYIKYRFLIVINGLAYFCVLSARLVGAYEGFMIVRMLAVAYTWRLMQCTLLGQNKVPPLYYLRNVLPFYDLPITVVFAAFCYAIPLIAKYWTAVTFLAPCIILWLIIVKYKLQKLKQHVSPTPASSSIPELLHIRFSDHFIIILLLALCVDLGVQLESLDEPWGLVYFFPFVMSDEFKGSAVRYQRKVLLCYRLPIAAAIAVFYGIVRTFPKSLLPASSMDLISLALHQCETEVLTGAAEVEAVSFLNTDLVHQHNYDVPHPVSSTSNFICDDPTGDGGSISVHVASSRDPPVSFVAAQLGDRPLHERLLRLLMPSTATLVSSFRNVICSAPVILDMILGGIDGSLELLPEFTGFAVVQLSKCMHIRWAKHKRPHGYCSREVERFYGTACTAIVVLSVVLRVHFKSLFVPYCLVLHLLHLILNYLYLYVSPREAIHEIQIKHGVELEQNVSRTHASSLNTELLDQQNYDVAHSVSSTTNFSPCETEDPTGAAEVGAVSLNTDESVDQRNYERQKWDPPTGDGGFASVHVASHRVEEREEDDANSTSDAANFSRWEKGEIIGAGGYGTVYVAYNRELKTLCAVKELKDIFKLENAESIKKEIKILSQLKHPNIVKYYGNEIVGHHISLYMEYIQPGSLKKYISKGGVLCEPLIQNFTAQILSGLVYLHSKRVVHRDIKPDNLLVDSNNIVKLVDFGLAKHLAESVGKHSVLGTPYYAAPEVLNKIECKRSPEAYAADIWSLGCVIIEMFSGKHPWSGFEPVFFRVCLKEEHPDIPEGLCQDGKDFLEVCFARNPAQRPSAAALLEHPFVKAQTT